MADVKPTETKPAEKDLISVEVLRDYWTSEIGPDGLPTRVKAGTIVDISKDDALRMIEDGSVKRVK